MRKEGFLNFGTEKIVQNKSIITDRNTIHYYISGNKHKSTILFLHPAFSDHTCFHNQIDFFSQEFRVITIDLLGHGLSEVINTKSKIDKSIEHIQEIMLAEGVDNIHLVGVSMGALLAQYFALKNSEKVLSLTVLGGYNINHEDKDIVEYQRKEMFGWMVRAVFSMDAFRRYAGRISAVNKEEQIKFYESAQGFSRRSFSVMASLEKLIEERPNPKRAYPLLILIGEEDNDLSKRLAESWYKEEPESKFHSIEKAGHCANMDNSEAFNKIVYKTIISQ